MRPWEALAAAEIGKSNVPRRINLRTSLVLLLRRPQSVYSTKTGLIQNLLISSSSIYRHLIGTNLLYKKRSKVILWGMLKSSKSTLYLIITTVISSKQIYLWAPNAYTLFVHVQSVSQHKFPLFCAISIKKWIPKLGNRPHTFNIIIALCWEPHCCPKLAIKEK